MTNLQKLAAFVFAFGICSAPQIATAQTATKRADPAVVEAYLQATFGKASPEWQAKIVPDETLKACNEHRNEVPSAEAEKITRRELAKVVYPADGKLLGDWKEGAKIANNGRGGQFSDNENTVAGGNCYACHQLEQRELSFGTLGPSLTNYGKDRKFDPAEAKNAFTKIYDSQAVFACSNMPRFGANKFLTEKQITDLVALLFDPESPVNK
jgi:sulfur-oxidizing protein SoxX